MNNKFLNFEKFDAIIILHPSNLFYYSKYQNDDAIIILTPKENYYISDKRVKEEAEETLTSFNFVDIDSGGGYIEKAIEILRKINIKHLGYEEATILQKDYVRLKKFKLKPASKEIYYQRSIKSNDEILLIEKAQEVTDLVFEKLLNTIKLGMTESEVASFINSEIYNNNCSLAFETIVAFGKNTSKPHAHPGDTILRNGFPITVDFGAKYKGYCSDMTRSFVLGKPDDKYIENYNIVLEAQNQTINTLHAGMTGKECEMIARNYFKKHELEKFFIHSLGHSLGIDIHEFPRLNVGNNQPINKGVVASVEPGLYFPNSFGIRIEDIVVFKDNFVRNLTKSKKELIIL